jgi:hypothetical protein
MKCVINDQVVLSRALEGPLGPHIGAFAESRSALGYARWSMQREVRLAAGFSRWLKLKESRYAMSVAIMSRGTCVIARDRCALTAVMRPGSGTCWTSCVVRASLPRRKSPHVD